MKIYFAHPINTFGTIVEQYVEQMIMSLYPESDIINPALDEHQEGYRQHGMEYFEPIVKACHRVVVLPFPDGSIGAGMAKEIQWALDSNIRCIYIKFDIEEIFSLIGYDVMSVEQTRSKLKGQ